MTVFSINFDDVCNAFSAPHFSIEFPSEIKNVIGYGGATVKTFPALTGIACWVAVAVASSALPIFLSLVLAAAGTVLLYKGITFRTSGDAAHVEAEVKNAASRATAWVKGLFS